MSPETLVELDLYIQLGVVCARCLQRNQEDRYTMSECADQLRRILVMSEENGMASAMLGRRSPPTSTTLVATMGDDYSRGNAGTGEWLGGEDPGGFSLSNPLPGSGEHGDIHPMIKYHSEIQDKIAGEPSTQAVPAAEVEMVVAI